MMLMDTIVVGYDFGLKMGLPRAYAEPRLSLVPSVRIERTTYRLPYHFGFRRLTFVVWTIP